MSRTQITIVGGGIGGMTTALACALQGIEVRVLEQAQRITEVGAGLQLAPNATRILRHLGVFDDVMATAVMPNRFVIRDVHTGDQLYQAQLGPRVAAHFGSPYILVHRADLLDALLQAALTTGRVEVHTAKRVPSLHQDARAVTIGCDDGTEYRADAVIGADGLRSVLRREILDDSPPSPSTYVLYRGTGLRPTDLEDAISLYIGDHLHLMQYPIQGGTMVNRVVSFSSHRGAPGSDSWGTPEELTERFADTCGPVAAAVDAVDTDRRWLQYDRSPLAGWSRGRVALLGDAAHPMYQYLAQGAGQALEDAVTLATELARAPQDVAGALQAYETVRFPRASAVQRNTRFFGEFTHLGGVAADSRNYLLRRLPQDDYAPVSWLWGDGQAPIPHPSPRTLLYA